ncbi:hypothetical protein FRC12_022752 [Ceratobasidium sp. 428]|nr:hypothetical protein FRC12_022752 [Ceratobasidium sp. 428]
MAQLLSDLTRNIRPPNIVSAAGKHKYKQALKNTKVKLDETAQEVFVHLKTILTSDPVTQAPMYDGRLFVVTSNSSIFRFSAMLSQVWDKVDAKGNVHEVMYPITFAS